MAYNLETVLAEKLETVISRNVTNTRMRDFYDIHILQQIYGESLSAPVLRDALAATAKKRGTLLQMQKAEAIFDEVEESPVMEKLWQSYQKNYSYAADLSWHTVMDSIRPCTGQEAAYERWGADRQGSLRHVPPMPELGLCGSGRCADGHRYVAEAEV